MQNEKGQIVKKRQKERRQLLLQSLIQFNSHRDPLWHQTPEMGTEALIAVLDSKIELQKALKKGIIKRKKLYQENLF